MKSEDESQNLRVGAAIHLRALPLLQQVFDIDPQRTDHDRDGLIKQLQGGSAEDGE